MKRSKYSFKEFQDVNNNNQFKFKSIFGMTQMKCELCQNMTCERNDIYMFKVPVVNNSICK